jgi:hypothetical protein
MRRPGQAIADGQPLRGVRWQDHVDAWIDVRRSRMAKMDKTQLSETFLRYQGAAQGTVNWCPNETVPDDYYAI